MPFYMNQSLLLQQPKKNDYIELINYSGDATFNLITQNLIPKSVEQTTAVANQFKPYRSVVLCQKIYEFCRAYINYRFDKEGTEQIRLPRRTWADRQKGVDCEDFTIFISSILHNLKVNHTIKMVDFGQGWQHIYVVVGDIVLDPVQDKFNYEDSYEIAREYDFKVSQLGSIGRSLSISSGEKEFVQQVQLELERNEKHNKRSIEKLASKFGITDKTDIKELTELAIVNVCRKIANDKNTSDYEKYLSILETYRNQVILSHRTSISILLQQYSTASPIAFLAGLYVKNGAQHYQGQIFEPTAGNGMMTIAFRPEQCTVNEIDDTRYKNLLTQGFRKATQINAIYNTPNEKFDGVITNPPFGAVDPRDYLKIDNKYILKDLDHILSYYALNNLKSDGRCAIIIGGHTHYDSEGRVQAGKNRVFLSYLYRYFKVDDVININGDLYSRQGTSFDIRLILISGVKQIPEGFAPLKEQARSEVINTFEELYERVTSNFSQETTSTLKIKYKYRLRLQLQAKSLSSVLHEKN